MMQPPVTRDRCARAVYVIDVRHFLDDRGDIGPERGPARAMSEFVTAVIAHGSDFDRPDGPGPVCLECRKSPVDTTMADDEAISWRCPHCAAEGSVSNWQGTFWDLSRGSPSD